MQIWLKSCRQPVTGWSQLWKNGCWLWKGANPRKSHKVFSFTDLYFCFFYFIYLCSSCISRFIIIPLLWRLKVSLHFFFFFFLWTDWGGTFKVTTWRSMEVTAACFPWRDSVRHTPLHSRAAFLHPRLWKQLTCGMWLLALGGGRCGRLAAPPPPFTAADVCSELFSAAHMSNKASVPSVSQPG